MERRTRVLRRGAVALALAPDPQGKRLGVTSFSSYCDLFRGPKIGGAPRVSEKVGDRWEVAVA